MRKSFQLICLMLCLSLGAHAQGSGISWKKISQISLKDLSGKTVQIDGQKPTVFIMFSPECPLCRNYVPVLTDLQKSHPEIAFYAIFPGKAYALDELKSFQKDYKPGFTLLLDQEKKLSSHLGATTTPESIFINELGIVVYRGLIDNWPSSLGQKRKVITEKYLASAILQSGLNQPVITKQTKPVGCLINDL